MYSSRLPASSPFLNTIRNITKIRANISDLGSNSDEFQGIVYELRHTKAALDDIKTTFLEAKSISSEIVTDYTRRLTIAEDDFNNLARDMQKISSQLKTQSLSSRVSQQTALAMGQVEEVSRKLVSFNQRLLICQNSFTASLMVQAVKTLSEIKEMSRDVQDFVREERNNRVYNVAALHQLARRSAYDDDDYNDQVIMQWRNQPLERESQAGKGSSVSESPSINPMRTGNVQVWFKTSYGVCNHHEPPFGGTFVDRDERDIFRRQSSGAVSPVTTHSDSGANFGRTRNASLVSQLTGSTVCSHGSTASRLVEGRRHYPHGTSHDSSQWSDIQKPYCPRPQTGQIKVTSAVASMPGYENMYELDGTSLPAELAGDYRHVQELDSGTSDFLFGSKWDGKVRDESLQAKEWRKEDSKEEIIPSDSSHPPILGFSAGPGWDDFLSPVGAVLTANGRRSQLDNLLLQVPKKDSQQSTYASIVSLASTIVTTNQTSTHGTRYGAQDLSILHDDE